MSDYTKEQIRLIVRSELRKILDAGLMYTEEAKPQPKTDANMKTETISTEQILLANFPDDLRERLVAEEVGDSWLLKLTHFIRGEQGKEIWAKVNAVVKNLGGKWQSMGKASHWEVPK